MNSPDSSPPARRVTVRELARQLGLSPGAVSMALRENPVVAESTRRKVKRLANQLGYRPDPELSRLMHQVNGRRAPTFRATLAAITNVPKGSERPYQVELLAGATRRAQELGFALDLFRCEISPRTTPAPNAS